MPILEFYCPDNHTHYQFFARGPLPSGATPRCPDNPAFRMERRFSAFAVTGVSKKSEGSSDDNGPDLDDPRLASAMAELERDMQGLDDEHPDPRRLAHLMRRMSDLTGEQLPGPLREMVARLEKGEDPDTLEAEYADALEAFDPADPNADPGTPSTASRPRAPRNDPKLYELREYL